MRDLLNPAMRKWLLVALAVIVADHLLTDAHLVETGVDGVAVGAGDDALLGQHGRMGL